jgi:Zn-dependent protease with chaperone function
MKNALSLIRIHQHARLAICASFLLGAMRVGASDVPPSSVPIGAEHAASSPSSTSQTVPAPEVKTEKSGKYDADRIGQRSIGEGMNIYSLEKERAVGQAMATAIDSNTKLVTDPDINDYVNRLGQKIVRNSDAQVPFTIKVIDSPELRTFALPGGFLYVDKGLIMEMDSEAELAGLMAHEIAHVAARHATRMATRKYAWSMISIPISYLAGPAGLGARQIGPLTLRKFSRDAEIEADVLGIEYQNAAGYDPQAFVEALEKLNSREREMRARRDKVRPNIGFLANLPFHHQIGQAFANYPPTEERIRKVQQDISTLLPHRDDYVCDTSEFQEAKAKLAWEDRPTLRQHRGRDTATNGPVLIRHPSPEPQEQLELHATSIF